MPRPVAPQLATLVSRPPEGPEWVHEIKFDGYRLLCRRDGERVQIFTRNGHDWTARFPALVTAARKLKAQSAFIDGEAVVLDDKGVSSFARLQDAIARKDDTRIVYYVFDLLSLDGEDVGALPLTERKRKLKRILDPRSRRILYSEHIDGDGAKLLREACTVGLEGIISKRNDMPYRAGRNLDWQKSKCLLRLEFVIVGYVERSNAKNDFGSLMLGAREKGQIVYTGQVGTGWTDRTRKTIYEKLEKLRTPKPAVKVPRGVPTTGVHWVKPKLVAEVAFLSWTNDGLIRHPSFQGLREDKKVGEVVIERPAGEPGLTGGGDWRNHGRKK